MLVVRFLDLKLRKNEKKIYLAVFSELEIFNKNEFLRPIFHDL